MVGKWLGKRERERNEYEGAKVAKRLRGGGIYKERMEGETERERERERKSVGVLGLELEF